MISGYDWAKPKKGPLPEFFSLEPTYFEKEVIDPAKVAPYKVEVKVINTLGRGICATGHEIGDTFIFEGNNMKVIKSHAWNHDLCGGALKMIQPDIVRFMWGAYLHDARGDHDNKVGLSMCFDLKSPTIFQLRRIKNPESPYFKKRERGSC